MSKSMTLKDAEVLIHRLKEQYPNPKRVTDVRGQGDCCVGGAYLHARCVYGLSTENFPSIVILTYGLHVHNMELSKRIAYAFAHNIIAANDAGDFDGAYGHLLKALTYPGELDRNGGQTWAT